MTHKELVKRAATWMKGHNFQSGLTICPWSCHLYPAKMTVVLTEPQGFGFSEFPDVIGWDYKGNSVVLEVKRSHGDFYKEFRKEKNGGGMGDLRFFFTEPNVLRDRNLRGWGLIECHKRICKIIHRPQRRWGESYRHTERAVLVHEARFGRSVS